MLHRLNRHAADLVAAADGKCEPVAAKARLVGIEDHVGRGIIRVRIHRIGTVKALRGRKAQVENPEIGDARHVKLPGHFVAGTPSRTRRSWSLKICPATQNGAAGILKYE